jgi:hypothetical protein
VFNTTGYYGYSRYYRKGYKSDKVNKTGGVEWVKSFPSAFAFFVYVVCGI